MNARAIMAGLLVASATAAMAQPGVVDIYRHSAWGTVAPGGVEANGIRRNLAVGDSVTFDKITIAVTETVGAPDDGTTGTVTLDRSTLSLHTEAMSDTRTVDEGGAFNWGGYHIAVVAIYAKKGDLGFGSTVIEVATIDSLPKEVAESDKAGGAESRLRVRHKIDKLTLHHSATPLLFEDDLGLKLRNMQSWGARDRNWWDIPYHFIIALDGSVLEARDYNFVGDTNTRYDPTGHFLINCYGNYNDAEPNEKQLATIANLMAWAAVEFKIDPLKIYGHCDLAQTSCPGKNLHKYITDGSLQRMVEEAKAKGQPTLKWHDAMPAK